MEYNVTWGDGTLGLTLRAELGDDMPPVVGRITREGSAAALAGVAVGHLLVSVNGVETARRGYTAVVHILKTIPRPCVLRFRVPKSLAIHKNNRHSEGTRANGNSDNRSVRNLYRQASAYGDGRDHSTWSEPFAYPRQQQHASSSPRENRSTSSLLATNLASPDPTRLSDRTSQGSDHRSSNQRRSGGNSLPPAFPTEQPTMSPSHAGSITSDQVLLLPPPPSSSGRPKREMYTVEWVEGPLGMIFRPDDIDCHIPCIRKITGKGLGSRGIERARVGDILLEINGASTKEIGFRQSISTLKSLEKPAILKFKRMRRRVSRSRDKEAASESGMRTLPPPIMEDQEEPAARIASPAPTPHHPTTAPSPLLISSDTTTSSMQHLPLSAKLTSDAGMYDIVWREGELGLKLKPTASDVPMVSRLTGKGSASGLHNAHVGDVLVTVNGKLVDESSYTSTLRLLKHTPKPIILRFRPVVRDTHLPHHSMHPGDTASSSSSSSFHKRDQIPLDVAKQLVATSQGLDIMTDDFAGVSMREIEEGSKEANYLRVAAKAFVAIQADKKRGQKKAELTRAEREAQVLAEALEQLKDQARKYEEKLAKQKTERILLPATADKSKAVIATANSLFAELKSSDKFFSRDSIDFTHVEVNQDHLDKMRDDMLKDLSSITSSAPTLDSALVIPAAAQKCCFQCATVETTLLPFYLDDSDNQWYCETCWVQYYGDPILDPVIVVQEDAAAENDVPSTPEAAEGAVAPVKSGGGSRRPSTREGLSLLKEIEEKQARREAERMIKELEELRRSSSATGSSANTGVNAIASSERLSQPSSTDRMERDKRGKEELARHLQAAEAKAKADGNDALARKLEAQRKRSLVDVTSSSMLLRSTSDGAMSVSSIRDSNTSPTAKSDDEMHVRAYDEDEDTYDDEEYDQDTELLQNREDQNFAMAKELQRMHEVVHQAHRMSMMMLGEEEDEDQVSDFTGLSEDQVNLFKKLALESDHRVSLATQEYFRGASDDSDSDSEGDDDDDGGDGVWI
ncbi:hypothetical protein DYB28_002117 [Aphanomyces astaci]|uniref:PDZ domain-containing protein n=1 Tax=Aphanomyces astaci TaxID=112090 RepID=A0A9X8H895_APHAT|nr:hypothetical protein DYB28_002117 [Aphanomyces astaci]